MGNRPFKLPYEEGGGGVDVLHFSTHWYSLTRGRPPQTDHGQVIPGGTPRVELDLCRGDTFTVDKY